MTLPFRRPHTHSFLDAFQSVPEMWVLRPARGHEVECFSFLPIRPPPHSLSVSHCDFQVSAGDSPGSQLKQVLGTAPVGGGAHDLRLQEESPQRPA